MCSAALDYAQNLRIRQIAAIIAASNLAFMTSLLFNSLADFDFDLPDHLIAQTPPQNRGESRLLALADDGSFVDSQFAQILELIKPGDALVMNNTRVIPARVHGFKGSGGKLELLIERILDSHTVLAQLRVSHKPKVGELLTFNTQTLKVIEYQSPFVVLRCEHDILEFLHEHGEIPLPPYITRKPEQDDSDRYQTVYAQHDGAVAAPTAGLHFTNELLAKIKANNVQCLQVTLHVGAGTFKPVREEQLDKHQMHAERYDIDESTVRAINQVRADGGRIIAVGTTTLRALESACQATGQLQSGSRDTSIFIRPGYSFKVVDALITNFHLPKSTLLMLVAAFVGHDVIHALYAHAIEQNYRFFSYGDAMWLNRKNPHA